MKLKVQARNLQPGDVTGSGDVVMGSPGRGTRTPNGKVEVTLKDRTGYVRMRFWGAYTEINVERASAE